MEQKIKELFSEVETTLFESIKNIEIPEEKIYGCGFWLFYCDYRTIAVPCFAYNNCFDDESTRWSPPEWLVDVEDSVSEALQPIYDRLSAVMEGQSDDDWQRLIKYQWSFYCDLCLKINQGLGNADSPFTNWNKAKDFVIGVFEEKRGREDI